MTTTPDLATCLLAQLQMMGQVTSQPPTPYRHNTYTVVLAHGIPKFCTKNRWPGVHRGRLKACFQNAAHLSLTDPDRWIYTEGYAVRPSLTFTVGLHAWVLDAHHDYRVVDPTWRDTADSAYLGVPFTDAYLRRSLLDSGVYGLIDLPPTRHPVLRLDPSEYLHPDAAAIPHDFPTQPPQDPTP